MPMGGGVGIGIVGLSPVEAPATCTAEASSRDRVARTQRLGLWGKPDYAVMGAEGGAERLGDEPHFAGAEGRMALGLAKAGACLT
jgi:hypothetical protein